MFIESLLCAVIWAPLPCLRSQTDIISFNKTFQYVLVILQQGELRVVTVHNRLHARWVFGNRSKPRITLQSPPKTIVEMDEPQLPEELEGWDPASSTKSSKAKLKGGGGSSGKSRARAGSLGRRIPRSISPLGPLRSQAAVWL